MIQSAIAAGIALSRAIVRDMVPAEEAASLIGYVTMGMSLMPMLGPVIGGLLDEAFGWQAVFGFTFIVGLMVLAVIWADLGETNLTRSASFAAQLRTYPALFRSRRFWGYSATAALASGTFFAFLGGGPWVASVLLGMSPAELGIHFGFIAVGYMAGNFGSGRYAGRVGLQGMMLIGGLVAAGGVLLAMGLFAWGSRRRSASSPPWRWSGSATASSCRAPMPGWSRCGRSWPGRRRASAGRCRSAAARRWPPSPARC